MSDSLLRCRQVMPYLSAYVDDELDTQLREQVETHLATCPLCSREVARYQAIDGLLLSLPASHPSPEVLDRVLANTSSQNKEKAVRQSLRQPEKVLAPRSVPTFLAADANLAAPILPLRQLGGRRPSWLLATGLPTLAAILIVAMCLVFFHVRTSGHPSVTTPPPATNIQQVTREQVATLEPQLSFAPVMPTLYPLITGLRSVAIHRFSDPHHTRYLDVVWNLQPPLTTLRLREVGVPLASRAQYDYAPSGPILRESQQQLFWTFPGDTLWQPMSTLHGNTSDLIVGADFDNFSATLDIGVQGGNSITPTPTSTSNNATTKEVTTLRLVGLSMDSGVSYQTLASDSSPDGGSVVHYQLRTVGANDGKTYTWDVYSDAQQARSRATLYYGPNISGSEVYTDYVRDGQVTRCSPDSTCVALSSSLSDPVPLGSKALSFLSSGIHPDIVDGELWNLGPTTAPSVLGIGPEPVYALAFVEGPYPITVYVGVHTGVVVGVSSTFDSSTPPPGGPYATSPLVVPSELIANEPYRCSNALVAYLLIAYLPSSPATLQLFNPPEPVSGSEPNPSSTATCPAS